MKKKYYLYIFLCTFMCMMFSLLFETNIGVFVYRYIFDSKYSSEVMNMMHASYLQSLFLGIKEVWETFDWNFDYIIVWATNIMQAFIPIIMILSIMIFSKYEHNKISKTSLKISGSVFVAYLLFYIFSFFVSRGYHTTQMERELFLDLLGESFYYKHIFLYYLFDGIIRFFFAPFILSSAILYLYEALPQKNIHFWTYSILIGYLFLTGVSQVLSYIFGDIFLYFDPNTLFASGAYENISTMGIIGVYVIFWVLCKVIHKRIGGSNEIV